MKLISAVIAVLLCACSRHSTERVAVAGNTYCVPTNRLIEAPPWVPSGGTIKDEGLALRGCYWENSESCQTLKSVGSMSIYPRSSHAFTTFDAIQPDAFYRSITTEPDTKLLLTSNGLIELSNKRLSWLTFYWKPSEPQVGSTHLPSGTDKLMFTCETKGSVHLCNRIFNSKSLSVNYHFATSEPSTFDVAAQDAEIAADINGLICGAV